MLLELEKCVLEVYEFNKLIGNTENVDRKKLLAQAKVNLEEAKELVDALENESDEQVLKEAVDNLVTIHGFIQMLNSAKYNVFGAWGKVNANNMAKFLDDQTKAYYTKMAYEAQGKDVEVWQLTCDKWGVFNKEGKLLKPIGYEKVSVKEFTPVSKSNPYQLELF